MTATYDIFYPRLRGGLADTPLLLLALGEANYTLTAAPFRHEFGPLKDEQLFGKVPRLTIKSENGTETRLWESAAITGYLAAKFGFLPQDELTRAHLNSFVCSLYEIADACGLLQTFPTPELRKEYWIKLRDVRLPEMFKWHEKYLAARAADGLYYAGDKITLPDLVLFTQFFRCNLLFGDASPISETQTPQILKLIKSFEFGKIGDGVRRFASEFEGSGSVRLDLETMEFTNVN
ncbi:hypothetical protein BKA62DRAFT_723186 [Auriculariales sp. MPI-PUGE-AT-0066]|nr:hypothetical protein BKA62DRAFT_723186 [Auriculariales sp. MPI-PUGE-AT-0066]